MMSWIYIRKICKHLNSSMITSARFNIRKLVNFASLVFMLSNKMLIHSLTFLWKKYKNNSTFNSPIQLSSQNIYINIFRAMVNGKWVT